MNEKKSLKFEEELRDKVFQAKKECNYNPTYFLKMLNEKGGVQTAKDLIEKSLRTGKTSDGYTTLFISGRFSPIILIHSFCVF